MRNIALLFVVCMLAVAALACDVGWLFPQRPYPTYTPYPPSTEYPVSTPVTGGDTGTGIPEDILGNIFEPFFTTKRAIGGSGLGLPTVKSIVEMHGGKITISNKQEGQGVRVVVWFKA